jgi:hypothetical protein
MYNSLLIAYLVMYNSLLIAYLVMYMLYVNIFFG